MKTVGFFYEVVACFGP